MHSKERMLFYMPDVNYNPILLCKNIKENSVFLFLFFLKSYECLFDKAHTAHQSREICSFIFLNFNISFNSLLCLKNI